MLRRNRALECADKYQKGQAHAPECRLKFSHCLNPMRDATLGALQSDFNNKRLAYVGTTCDLLYYRLSHAERTPSLRSTPRRKPPVRFQSGIFASSLELDAARGACGRSRAVRNYPWLFGLA